MARNIMVLTGSPRANGNTNTVTNWVVEAARDAGAKVEIVNTATMKFATNGCTECMGCQKSDDYKCVVDDDASAVIARMRDFDVLLLSTPIFWFGPSAQLKLMLDRTFALVKFDPDTGDPIGQAMSGSLALVATAGGGPEDGLDMVDESFRTATGFLKCDYDSLIVPNAPQDPSEMANNDDVKKQAFDFGKRLARGNSA